MSYLPLTGYIGNTSWSTPSEVVAQLKQLMRPRMQDESRTIPFDETDADYVPTREELEGNSWGHCYGQQQTPFIPPPAKGDA